MGLVIFLILTYPVSYLIELANSFDIAKDAGKNGYLVNIDAFKKGSNNENKHIKHIPLINLANSIKTFLEYRLNRQESFENYRVFGYLDLMNKEEEEAFNEKPTALRALNLASKRRTKYIENEKENLKCNIRFYNSSLDDHDYIIKENDECYSVDLPKYIEILDREQLENLKESLITMTKCQDMFVYDNEGDYTLSEEKCRSLVLRYRCKKSDNNEKTST